MDARSAIMGYILHTVDADLISIYIYADRHLRRLQVSSLASKYYQVLRGLLDPAKKLNFSPNIVETIGTQKVKVVPLHEWSPTSGARRTGTLPKS